MVAPMNSLLAQESQGYEKDAVFLFPQNGFFPLIGPEPPRVGAPNKRHEKTRDFARSTLQTFETILRKIRAVGAFRLQPDRRYEYQGRASESIDAAGRSVVDALIEDSTRRGRSAASCSSPLING